MDAPALLKREGLVAVRLGAENASDLIKDATETCGGGERWGPGHGPVALFNAPMVLRQLLIQGGIGPVRHLLPEGVPEGTRVGVMAIGRDPNGCAPDHRPCGAKKGFGRRQVTRAAAPRIDSVAVAVDRT